ncbi:hypothetical protein CLV40_103262 [Actinokineospora auranticolor]|uniref:Uncharacterized protein n=1 Tax=Actinokineospora auranticolor TaxID=155976 RepID=A0A2S6GWN4_9PSEU|nr:hypothetical protein CLV40_103262 [Actinokineospora auranticolor]
MWSLPAPGAGKYSEAGGDRVPARRRPLRAVCPRRADARPEHAVSLAENLALAAALEVDFPAHAASWLPAVEEPVVLQREPALIGARAAFSEEFRTTGNTGPSLLPVHPGLTAAFPWGGLRRGGTVSVRGNTSLLLNLLAGPSAAGAWAAVVGLPDLGLAAAAEMGVDVDRLALVPEPGPEVAKVVAALMDGFDVVAVAAGRIGESLARRLSARARNRGAALVAFGAWPGAEVELTAARGRWAGLGDGFGHLRAHQAEVRTRGRGAAARPARLPFTLQGSGPLTVEQTEHMFENDSEQRRAHPS